MSESRNAESSDSPYLDLRIFHDATGGDDAFGQVLLSTFFRDSAARIRQAQTCLEHGDLAGVKAVAHTLKGSASTLGFREIALLCLEVERCATSEAPQVVQRAIRCLETSEREASHWVHEKYLSQG